jgi:hypothetical protein
LLRLPKKPNPMNYYFLPQVPFLKSTVTLANFPPTATPSWDPQSAFVYATFSTGINWKIFFVKEIAAGDTLSLGMQDLPEQPPAGRAVFIFMYPKILPEYLESLPIDHFMKSEPNWRGNIQLSSNTTSVSYQGEYPGVMLNNTKGTLLTFNPLIQTQSRVNTQLILVNILRTARIQEGQLFVARQVSGEIEKECKVSTNTCNLIDLAGLQDDSENPLCLYSPDMVGVPIFLSHDPSYRFLSLEHSYPLQEVTVFGDVAQKQRFLKKIKSHWIDHLEKNVSH